MDVILEKLTSINEAKELIETSVNGEYKSKIKNLTKLYMSEHSPMYSQIFKIKLIGIPYFVHTHIRTHKSHFIVEKLLQIEKIEEEILIVIDILQLI